MSCFKKKGVPYCNPADPSRRRANKRRGHGTYETDRSPIVGTIAHGSGQQVRSRAKHHTDKATLPPYGHVFTPRTQW